MEFPSQQELIAMKAVMDGEETFSKPDFKSGMLKIEAKSLYDLILWGLRAGIIQDPPMPEVKDYAMTDPKKYHESYPSWLKLLSGLVSGYSPREIESNLGLGKDSQEFYHKKIAIEFHLHPSKARLIRFAFQVLNPIKPPPRMHIDWRPWTGSRTSLMRIPQTMTGSQIDPDAVVTKDTPVKMMLKLLRVKELPRASGKKISSIWLRPDNELWEILEKAKIRRDEEIKKLIPLANRSSDDPIVQQQTRMAEKQLSVVNTAWRGVRALFARHGYTLPGDEELLIKYKPRMHIPGQKKPF